MCIQVFIGHQLLHTKSPVLRSPRVKNETKLKKMQIEDVICILTIENLDSHASITTALYNMKKKHQKNSSFVFNCLLLL